MFNFLRTLVKNERSSSFEIFTVLFKYRETKIDNYKLIKKSQKMQYKTSICKQKLNLFDYCKLIKASRTSLCKKIFIIINFSFVDNESFEIFAVSLWYKSFPQSELIQFRAYINDFNLYSYLCKLAFAQIFMLNDSKRFYAEI